MSIVLDGTNGVTTNSGTVVSTTDATINGLTVGLGGGSVANNTIVGRSAGAANTTGAHNSVLGNFALYANTTGSYNVSVGDGSLISNTTANYNTAVGYQAGYTANAAGNTHIGYQAGYGVTSGSYNTFVGIGAGLSVTSGGSNTILGAYSGNQGGLDIRTASNYIVLSDGAGNPRGYFDGNGNLGINGAPYAVAKTTINSATNNNLLAVVSTYGSGWVNAAITANVNTAGSTGWKFFEGDNSGGTAFNVYGNGNVTNTNNSYGAISDIKLKENIVDATPKLADLMQVKIRNYNFKTDPNTKQLGVIAQELETIFPSMIEESTDKDSEGNPSGTVTKNVKYSVFVPMLVKAVQELNTLVTTQATEITALKAKVGI